MSITDFINKIKGNKNIDNFTYFYLLILIFTGFSAFFLGRLSMDKGTVINSLEVKNLSIAQKNQAENAFSPSEKKYLASKNGKLYYTVGCSGANRIAEKNIIWFDSSVEAELAGYVPSESCNK